MMIRPETIHVEGDNCHVGGTITKRYYIGSSNDMSCAWQTTANLCGKPSTTDSAKGTR